MADEENKKNPKIIFSMLREKLDKVVITLNGAKEIATGESKYGAWNLWSGNVENEIVYDDDKNPTQGYSGEVVFFPSLKLHEKLLIAAGGKDKVKVEVTKVGVKGKVGNYTTYNVTKLSEGEISEGTLSPGETKLVEDYKGLIGNIEFSENDFVNSSKETQYGGQITPTRAKELFKLVV